HAVPVGFFLFGREKPTVLTAFDEVVVNGAFLVGEEHLPVPGQVDASSVGTVPGELVEHLLPGFGVPDRGGSQRAGGGDVFTLGGVGDIAVCGGVGVHDTVSPVLGSMS